MCVHCIAQTWTYLSTVQQYLYFLMRCSYWYNFPIFNTAWYPTLQRQRTFGFSNSFSKSRASGFAVLAGNPEGFAADDIAASDCLIGFIRGFFADPGCVRREVLEVRILTVVELCRRRFIRFRTRALVLLRKNVWYFNSLLRLFRDIIIGSHLVFLMYIKKLWHNT